MRRNLNLGHQKSDSESFNYHNNKADWIIQPLYDEENTVLHNLLFILRI